MYIFTSITGGEVGIKMADKANLHSKESVAVGTGHIGWNVFVLSFFSTYFPFPQWPLLITCHSGCDKSLPCWPVSCGLFPGDVWNVEELESLLGRIYKSRSSSADQGSTCQIVACNNFVTVIIIYWRDQVQCKDVKDIDTGLFQIHISSSYITGSFTTKL